MGLHSLESNLGLFVTQSSRTEYTVCLFHVRPIYIICFNTPVSMVFKNDFFSTAVTY